MEIKLPCVEARDTVDAFGLAVYEVARGWRARIDVRLRPLGLSSAAFLVIWTLASSARHLTQKELAALCFVESPSMVRLLDRLEAKGYARRVTDQTDRRKNHVVLTEAALPLVEEMMHLARGVRDELLDGIPQADLEAALSVLRVIRERIDN